MRPVRIVGRRDETPDIATFELAAPSGEPLPGFDAGAHVEVEAAPGIVRAYSLLDLPNVRNSYTIGVLREPQSRGGSLAMHRLQTGDELRISDPRNRFPMERGVQMTALFAGGIGVTPLLAMAQQLTADGADFVLHYCVRSRAHAAFSDRIEAFGPRARMHVDDGPDAQKLDIVGSLERLRGAHIYVCGPAGFMNAILQAATAGGHAPENLHREYFHAEPPSSEAGDGAFSVKLARSGRTVEVGSGQSILEALLAHGVDAPMSCGAGVCGTCLTRVLEGEPDHRDFYLNKAEKARGDQMLLCCSRAKSPDLVLEL